MCLRKETDYSLKEKKETVIREMYLSENTQDILEHTDRHDYLPSKWLKCCAEHSI